MAHSLTRTSVPLPDEVLAHVDAIAKAKGRELFGGRVWSRGATIQWLTLRGIAAAVKAGEIPAAKGKARRAAGK